MDALCPLDGRYAERVQELRPYFSEYALTKERVGIEVQYLIALGQESGVIEFSDLDPSTKSVLLAIYHDFSDVDFQHVREIEKKINHDVKAVEYFLRDKIQATQLPIPAQFIHFGLTSEDVTNLAYGCLITGAISQILLPHLELAAKLLSDFAEEHEDVPMLGMTHGQPATLTSVGDQVMVFAERLEKARDVLAQREMDGKLGGAVGNFAAHKAAYPAVNWEAFRYRFVSQLGLIPLDYTKQINSHDDLARLSHAMIEVNTILLDLCRDMWLYISRGVFSEKIKEGEVGSSVMPHKVNPLDWENAEGNLGLATALFAHFAQKLPISRMQRDLSDSTVQRWLGCAFGAHLLAVKSILKGLTKLRVNKRSLQEEIADNPAVHAEAIQTVMRRYGCPDAYEQLKEITRGQEVTADALAVYVWAISYIPVDAKQRLTDLLGK